MKIYDKHRHASWKFSTPMEAWLVLAIAVLLIATIILFVHKLL